MTEEPNRPQPAENFGSMGQAPKIVTTADLFGGADEIVLLHKGSPYRLRITRQDKLILTK